MITRLSELVEVLLFQGGRVMLASAAVPVAPPPSLANPQKQVGLAWTSELVDG